jgi:V8-like Glu-specific endopeptidase
VCIGAAVAGCGEAPAERLGRAQEPFVNGEDDRKEYFELEPGQRAAVEQFAVVLTTEGAADALVSGRADVLPTWRQVNRLCAGEPFAEQTAGAFCSGVLVDWRLVLTSGHCVDAIPLEELRVMFGYYLDGPDQLALGAGDVYSVDQVVASRRDEEVAGDQGERLDYAWIELSEPVQAPHRPAAVYTRGPGVAVGDPVVSVGAGGGVPIKWDAGGHVQDTRSEFEDYFIADTDTSQGSSGGGVYDAELRVVGSLARGAADFSRSDAGCFVTNRESDPALALEQFTYAYRAVEGLCETGYPSAICEDACEEPCETALRPAPAPQADSDDGCALRPARSGAGSVLLPALGALALLRRRARAGVRR